MLHDANRKKPGPRNRVEPAIEEAVTAFALEQPTVRLGRNMAGFERSTSHNRFIYYIDNSITAPWMKFEL